MKREDIVVSTKLYFGNGNIFDRANAPPNCTGLSRKHIIEGAKISLRKLQLDYVDIIFGSRPDFETPLEETGRAFSWLVDKGYALYWGTSEWPVEMITEAVRLCHELGLTPPVVEQPQYNMLSRERFEKEYRHIYENYKYGTTVWSPLASGLLTGRYNDGSIPDDSRFNDHPQFKHFVMSQFFSPEKKDKNVKALKGLAAYARELGYTQT